MPDNKTKSKDGSHLKDYRDLCVYEVALLKAAPYNNPLSIDYPKRLTELFVRGLIAKGLLERNPLTANRNYTVRRTVFGDTWLADVLLFIGTEDA